MESREVVCEVDGAAGLLTLDRPAALNALTHGMVRRIATALDDWEADDRVTRVVIRGAGGRAFSAGGDVRRLHDDVQAGRTADALAFWRDEYRLNGRIKRYRKPFVALIDGFVFGGGVGLSLHGSHRVAGDGYCFAMPETAIGFFPDVGATFALPRLPGGMGFYLALTGARMGPDDAVRLGLATHRVRSTAIAELAHDLTGPDPVPIVLDRHSVSPGPGDISAQRAVVDACFAAPSLPEVLHRLDEAAASGSDFAGSTAKVLGSRSPTSLAVAFEQMRRGPDLCFEEALATEFRIAARIIHGHDFVEGVRAALVDRDGSPRWRPDTLADLDPAAIAAHFEPLGPFDELYGDVIA